MPTPASQRTRKPAPPPARSRSGPLVLVVLAIAAALAGVWWIREGGRDEKHAKAKSSASAESETPAAPPTIAPSPPPLPIATPSPSIDAEPSAAPSATASAPDAMSTMELADLADERLAREAARCVKTRDKAKDNQRITVLYMLVVKGGVAKTSDVDIVESDLDKELEACVVDRLKKAQWDAPGAPDATMKRNFSRRVGDFVYADGGA